MRRRQIITSQEAAMSFKSIARQLGCSPAVARSIYSRAMRKLARNVVLQQLNGTPRQAAQRGIHA